MNHIRLRNGAVVAIGGALLLATPVAWGQSKVPAPTSAPQATRSQTRDLPVGVGKSLVVESPVPIQRVAVGDRTKAEARAVSQREVLINGIAPGETSLIIWQEGGSRLLFDLRVLATNAKLDGARRELRRELPDQDINLMYDDGSVFVRGTAKDVASADRAIEIAKTMGKPVNLLRVKIPRGEQQILLKVKFAQVDRALSHDMGANIFSLGSAGMIGSLSTGQYAPPSLTADPTGAKAVLPEMLNIFLMRMDIGGLAATIKLLQSKNLLEILAEPNLMAVNGKEASFLAGGEFPFPVVSPGAGGTTMVTITWREFGIKLNFTPTITPRGTIRLKVKPEVSSLDQANGVTFSGFRIPAISTRRVNTEVELQDGQSFVVAGLLDNRVTEQLSKMPGLGDIPLLGKLFQSRSIAKSNTELMILVTPEIVRPIPVGQPLPGMQMPVPFMKGVATVAPRHPAVSVTGEVAPSATEETLPYEQLQALREPTAQPTAPTLQLMIAPPAPAPEGGAASTSK